MEAILNGETVVEGGSPTGYPQHWQLFHQVPDALIVVDQRGTIVFVNHQADRLFGYAPNEMIGLAVHDLVPERHRAQHREQFAAFFRSPTPRPLGSGLELNGLHRDGHELPVDISLNAFETDGGLLVTACIRDVSERRRHLEAIRESVHFNMALLASLQERVAVLDRSGKILAVNEAWNQFALENGGQASDRLGPPANYLDVYRSVERGGDDTVVPALAGIRAVLDRTRPVFTTEYRCDAPEENCWFEMKVVPLVSVGGGAVVSHANITSRRQAEEKRNEALLEVKRLKKQLDAENVYLREEIKSVHDFEVIVGKSAAVSRLLGQIRQVARTNSNVLIHGETGTGKELVARAIHACSARKDRPLVKVNCAALPGSLLESELFGHRKGSFTGAFADRIGRFELAHESSIFLDEIGEIPVELQSKLLHVLENGEFEPLGSNTTKKVDTRVIAATNRDLQQSLDDKSFRPDLYYRLAVFPIEVPPLRLRRGDIPLLAWHFVTKHQARLGTRIQEIPGEATDQLVAYDWPGNVRELENVVERAMILSAGPSLEVADLLHRPLRPADAPPEASDPKSVARAHLLKVLNECGWKIKGAGHAAERLGVKPGTVRYRMKKLGIERPAE